MDMMGLALGSAGLGGLINTGYGIYNSKRNYHQQQNLQEYNAELQQQIFAREDNATQRRVADLKAAGLSPVIAAGSAAGSGGIVSTAAPQHQQVDASNTINEILQAITMSKTFEATDAQIALNKAQIKTQEGTQNLQQMDAIKKLYETDMIGTRTQSEKQRQAINAWNMKIAKASLTPVGSGGSTDVLNTAGGILGKILTYKKPYPSKKSGGK